MIRGILSEFKRFLLSCTKEENIIAIILFYLFYSVKKEHGFIYTFLTYENYYLGYLANIFIIFIIGNFIGAEVRQLRRRIYNKVMYKYFWDDKKKQKYDDAEKFVNNLK